MADTFFGFNSSLNNNGDNDSNILPPDEDDCIENEEEYDALNDETFGALEDATTLDDWEQQHEQYAEIAESSKHSEQLENSLSQLVLDDYIDPISLSRNSVWSYKPTTSNGDIFKTNILSSLQKASKSFIESHVDQFKNQHMFHSTSAPPALPNPPHPNETQRNHHQRKFCTVEELEKSLMKSKPLPPLSAQVMSTYGYAPRLPPPGMPPMTIPPPGLGHLPPHPLLMMRMMPPQPQFPPRPPGFLFPPGHNQMPMGMHLMPPPPPQQQQRLMNNGQMNMNQRVMQQNYPQQRVRHDSGGGYNRQPPPNYEQKDEYDGLMTNREKQWLLNIQMLQLNTGTPYFDDYYYTVFKERRLKANKENFPSDRNLRFPPNRQQQRNNERQDNANTLTPRVYTPLQFENSLGKLQCGSVTAPRKIIDMDIVTPDKDGDNPSSSRDTRKTKQLLLELESMYCQLLKAEDLKNPLAISNMEKLREIKQKQRLRELELAPTPEQKQEVLRLFKLESEPIVENQLDYIVKIVAGLLHEEKFSSFLNIRKGKMLLLRTLPHLPADTFAKELLEIWSRVLLSLAIVGRRDMAGDNILPKLHPFFKRFIQSSKMSDILDVVTGLVEVIRQENHRSTPLSHQGKAPLYFVLLNKFGVSALVMLFIRGEYLISSATSSDKQQNDWSNFLVSWSELTGVVAKVAQPIELIPMQIFSKHCNRFANLTPDKRRLLEKHFVEAS